MFRGGMTWQSDYNLVVSDENKFGNTDLLDMIGWITMQQPERQDV